jgi:hypothetical protein
LRFSRQQFLEETLPDFLIKEENTHPKGGERKEQRKEQCPFKKRGPQKTNQEMAKK